MHYDIIVVGSGPAGQKAAIAAAKQLDRVAIVDRRPTTLGGVCLHSGTIPSKTMREAILHLTGYRQRDIYRSRYRNKRHIRMKDLRRKLNEVTNHELNVIHDQLDRNGVHVYTGNATFRGPHSIFVHATDHQHVLSADKIILACGTVPSRPDNVPFDNLRILDSDQILRIDHIPQSLIVVGGGVIGIEYAIMFAALGVRVTVVDGRPRLLEFCDQEIVDVLLFHAREMGMTFRLGENVTGFHKTAQNLVAVETESGKRLVAESVMYSAGRVGDTAGLNLELAGLHPDTRGRLKCDENHRTEAPHIYAVGDIVGFPALASTAKEQGRRAVCHALGIPYHQSEFLPYGLFTIPEISMVGKTEQELTQQQVPYEVGIAHFRECTRGAILGDMHGLLKLLFHRESHQLLGVHCIGEQATEIIHIGQAVMALGGKIDYLANAVFNVPTIAECYKVAALDGLNRTAFEVVDNGHVATEHIDPCETESLEATLESLPIA